MNLRLLVLACCLAAAPPVAAQSVVTEQSEIGFVSRQMGAPVEGRFRQWSAQMSFDPKKPEHGQVSLTIATGSASFGAPEADAEVPKPVWFNAAQFPQATFQSTAIKFSGPGRYDVSGTLTLKGQAREVVVPVTFEQRGIHGTATGSFTIRRLDFRVGEGEWADTSIVANDVLVKFRLVLINLAPM